LRWTDVDLDDARLSVQRSLERVKGVVREKGDQDGTLPAHLDPAAVRRAHCGSIGSCKSGGISGLASSQCRPGRLRV
jgi:hypothetical protein